VLFHLLRLEGRREEWAEIRDRCAAVSKLVAEGRVSEGLEAFVDYWNGAGAYRSLAEPRRHDLDRTAPKLVLDFQALFEEKTPLAEFAGIQAPLSLSVGERTRPSARAVAELLAGARGVQAPWVIDQAGHMAPITHAAQVNRLIVERLSPSR
jgi:pimeloyl-ACP methyl ester carboxylesterase